MTAIASPITSLIIVYSTVSSGADQRKHQSSASLVFVRGIHRWPVNSPHKGPAPRKMSPFDDVIMITWHQNGGPSYVRYVRAWYTITSSVSIQRCHLKSVGIPTIKITRSDDPLIFICEFPLIERRSLYWNWALSLPLKATSLLWFQIPSVHLASRLLTCINFNPSMEK